MRVQSRNQNLGFNGVYVFCVSTFFGDFETFYVFYVFDVLQAIG